MKYGKLLQTLLEEMPPEYRDKFLSYKQLKKRIKQFLDSNSFPEAAFEPAPVVSSQEEQEVPAPAAGVVVGSGVVLKNRENSGAVHDDNLADENVRWPPAIFLDGNNSNKQPSARQGTPALAMAVSALMDLDEGEEETREGNNTESIVGSSMKRKRAVAEASVPLGRESHGLVKGETSASAQEGGGGGGGDVREKAADGVSDRRREAPDNVRHFLDAVSRQGVDRGQAMGEEKEVTPEEEEFIRLLNVELEKFNSFFTEKEEDYVIQLQELKDRLKNARMRTEDSTVSEELLKIHTGLVTFHGDVVLMESYSALNYTGLVKILKKHDKRTGAVLRLPFIRRVLLQPFFSTELLSKLVQECESLLSFFPASPAVECIDVERVDGEGAADSTGEVPKDVEEFLLMRGEDVQSVYKSLLAALRTLQEMRKGSSTVSSQSLPPCNMLGNDEKFGAVLNETVQPTPAVVVSQAE